MICDLLELSEKKLPIHNGIIFEYIKKDELVKITENTIHNMAKAYLKILEIQGNNPLSLKIKDIPKIENLAKSDNSKYSVGDYISQVLFNDNIILKIE